MQTLCHTIRRYEAAFGSAPGLDDYVARAPVPAVVSGPLSFSSSVPVGTQPTNGDFVFASVWRVGSQPFAGAALFASSEGIVVDTTVPQFVPALSGDITWSFDPGTTVTSPANVLVRVPLRGFVDPETRITDFQVLLESSAGATTFGAPGNTAHGVVSVAGTAREAQFPSIVAHDGDHFVAQVTATNKVNLQLQQSVTGGPVIIADVSPGLVSDGPQGGGDLEYFLQANAFPVHWTSFPSNVPVTYEVGLGTSPGATDVVSFEPSGNGGADLSIILTIGLPLPAGTVVYAAVRGTASPGVDAIGLSDGAMLDNVGLVADWFVVARTTRGLLALARL